MYVYVYVYVYVYLYVYVYVYLYVYVYVCVCVWSVRVCFFVCETKVITRDYFGLLLVYE